MDRRRGALEARDHAVGGELPFCWPRMRDRLMAMSKNLAARLILWLALPCFLYVAFFGPFVYLLACLRAVDRQIARPCASVIVFVFSPHFYLTRNSEGYFKYMRYWYSLGNESCRDLTHADYLRDPRFVD